jgi:hypothetical protein
MFYLFIENGVINGCGECPILNEEILNIEVSEDIFTAYSETPNKFIWNGETIVENPDYEVEEEEKERERINGLKCTKRVFALMLQELGIDYLTMLKPLIESNSQAQLEWDLCIELERNNPLLDIMAGQLGVTPVQLDGLFRYANGEITIEEFQSLRVENEQEGNTEEIVLPETA